MKEMKDNVLQMKKSLTYTEEDPQLIFFENIEELRNEILEKVKDLLRLHWEFDKDSFKYTGSDDYEIYDLLDNMEEEEVEDHFDELTQIYYDYQTGSKDIVCYLPMNPLSDEDRRFIYMVNFKIEYLSLPDVGWTSELEDIKKNHIDNYNKRNEHKIKKLKSDLIIKLNNMVKVYKELDKHSDKLSIIESELNKLISELK